VSDLGEILYSARQKRRLDLIDVAVATRIQPSYLEALEHGDYDSLPGPAYITGFLRNYAAYLGLHPDDIVQEYYATRPPAQPSVQAATRVLASGRRREYRTRLLWSLAGIVLLLAGGFAIKQYDDTYAKPEPPLSVTPSNLGVTGAPLHHPPVATDLRLRLRATAPTWIRLTVDGRRAFQGVLRPGVGPRLWIAHRSIYLMTYDGSHLRLAYNGQYRGLLTPRPGLVVDGATHATGWQRIL
jgi:transcriptional regulator with XRE-family HTH domain